MKLVPVTVLNSVNFDPIQKIEPKVGDGRSFMRLQYWLSYVVL